MNDETTKEIFPLPPLTSYRPDQNIRDILVYTFIQSQSGSSAGTYPCGAPRCRTCAHVSATTIIEGPRHNITIREHFTCKSSNVVYCISCRRCPGACSGNAPSVSGYVVVTFSRPKRSCVLQLGRKWITSWQSTCIRNDFVSSDLSLVCGLILDRANHCKPGLFLWDARWRTFVS